MSAPQVVYEITVTKEYVRINDLSSTITLDSGISVKVGDLGLMDSVACTYLWVHVAEACPKTLVQLYRGFIQVFSNNTSSLEGSLAMMKDKEKEQVAGQEFQHMFVFFVLLCGNSGMHTRISNMAVFTHQDQRMEVARGKNL